jgi:ligand-binding sensor domain-containing protein
MMKVCFTKWIPVFLLTILFQFSSQAQEKVPVERCHQFLQGVPVNCMQSDDVNMLWVGTNMGLYIFNYFEGVRTIMEGAAVTALATDDRGYMWCSLAGGIVASADKTKRFSIADEDVEISSMQIRNNKIWLATTSKGVYVWDMKTLEISAHYQASNSDLPSDEVNFLFKDAENRIWIGTELGLAIVTGNRWRTNLEERNITAIGYYDDEI